MRNFPRLSRFCTACLVLLFIAVTTADLRAQTPPAPATRAKPVGPEELSQAELLDAYHNVREQLRSAQTAIVNNRFEFEATSRAQAAAIAEKINAVNATLAEERSRRQSETDRLEFERERQQAEIQRSNRSVVWIASGFGALGLLTMLSAALFQWRAINRMATFVEQRPQLGEPTEYDHLPAPTSQPVAQTTQRLMSTVERMEQRIKELEHTSTPPIPSAKLQTGQTQENII